MDDVTFGRSGPYGGRCDTGAESDVYQCIVTVAFWEIVGCFMLQFYSNREYTVAFISET